MTTKFLSICMMVAEGLEGQEAVDDCCIDKRFIKYVLFSRGQFRCSLMVVIHCWLPGVPGKAKNGR